MLRRVNRTPDRPKRYRPSEPRCDSSVVGTPRLAQQLPDDGRRKPASRHKPGLALSSRFVGRFNAKSAGPQGTRAVGLAGAQLFFGAGVERQTVALQIVADALDAEARLAHAHTAFDKALLRKQPLRVQPCQQRVDLGRRAACVSVVRPGLAGGRSAQQLDAQLGAAVFALRQPAQRALLQW